MRAKSSGGEEVVVVVVEFFLAVMATAGTRAVGYGAPGAEPVGVACGCGLILVGGARSSAVVECGGGAVGGTTSLFIFLCRLLQPPSTVGKPRGHL